MIDEQIKRVALAMREPPTNLSADKVVGIAVLNHAPNGDHLLILCGRRDGKPPHFAHLPAVEKGHSTTHPNFWTYRRVNERRLEVTPSVSLKLGLPTDKNVSPAMKEVFHNSACWQIPFVEITTSLSQSDGAWSLWRELNPEMLASGID